MIEPRSRHLIRILANHSQLAVSEDRLPGDGNPSDRRNKKRQVGRIPKHLTNGAVNEA